MAWPLLLPALQGNSTFSTIEGFMDYPRVLYHTAIKRQRDNFGNIVPGAAPINSGDPSSPSYPVPLVTFVDKQTLHERGHLLDGVHLVPRLPYRTTLAETPEQEKDLIAHGWVTHPGQLKAEYED